MANVTYVLTATNHTKKFLPENSWCDYAEKLIGKIGPYMFLFQKVFFPFFDCCKQSLNWLQHPPTHPGPYFFAQKMADCNFTVYISS